MPDLILRYELTTGIRPVSTVVGSMFVPVSERRHHAVSSERWDRIITDFAQCGRVDVVAFDV
jgi:hypothetical protein